MSESTSLRYFFEMQGLEQCSPGFCLAGWPLRVCNRETERQEEKPGFAPSVSRTPSWAVSPSSVAVPPCSSSCTPCAGYTTSLTNATILIVVSAGTGAGPSCAFPPKVGVSSPDAPSHGFSVLVISVILKLLPLGYLSVFFLLFFFVTSFKWLSQCIYLHIWI